MKTTWLFGEKTVTIITVRDVLRSVFTQKPPQEINQFHRLVKEGMGNWLKKKSRIHKYYKDEEESNGL